MLEFSLESRRWTWDFDVIDMQMISDGAAELLTTTFSQLPSTLMQTLQVASCIGSQVEYSILDLLTFGHLLPVTMSIELERAVKEGIMEKAGPIFQFTHGIVRDTIYESMSPSYRRQLHIDIGMALLESAANNPAIHLLLAEQINKYCKDADLDLREREQYANLNATAAKYSNATSNFEQGWYSCINCFSFKPQQYLGATIS